jgi:hypothetical protein
MYSLPVRAHWGRTLDLIHSIIHAEIAFVFSSCRIPHISPTRAAGPLTNHRGVPDRIVHVHRIGGRCLIQRYGTLEPALVRS